MLTSPLIVTYRNGAPVRLEELATVTDSVEDDKAASWFNTPPSERARHRARRAAPARHQHRGGRGPREGAAAVLPGAASAIGQTGILMTDRSPTIRESFEDVQFTMVLTLGLVVMVIFLFLRNVSATIIPSLALPVSVIGTFAVMYLCGYSLDNLSMMALILAIGFVVDDAIVVLENIVRHMEMGSARRFGRRSKGRGKSASPSSR